MRRQNRQRHRTEAGSVDTSEVGVGRRVIADDRERQAGLSWWSKPELQRARVFAGVAGWGPEQLEEELDRDDWIIEPAAPEDIFTDDPDGLWSAVLRRKGGRY